MNICSRYHEEVVFENHKCPVCELITDKDSQIELLNDKVKELQGNVDELVRLVGDNE